MTLTAILKSVRAFTLVEVLGATAVLATLATISVVSIKDSVQAGQKAAAQRELQGLNTALQNFKSAGGVIADTATAAEAVAALRVGTNLSGSNFTQLTSDPELIQTIAGEEYTLNYDPEKGFSYQISDGSGVGFSGSELVAAGATEGYTPGDIIDSTNLSLAIDALGSATPGSPEYDAILAALNAAMAFDSDLGAYVSISEEEASAIYAAINDQGLSHFDETWGWLTLEQNEQAMEFADIVYFNPAQINSYLADLPAADIARLLAAEFDNFGVGGFDLSNLDLSQLPSNVGSQGYGYSFQNTNLVGATISVAQLNATTGLFINTNLSGLNLSGLNLANKNGSFFGANASNTNLAGSNFAGASFYSGGAWGFLEPAGSGGTGFNEANLTNANLAGSNFTGCSIAIAQLVQASNLSNIDLTNTGIYRGDLEAALSAAGKSGGAFDLNTVTFSDPPPPYEFIP